MESNQYVYYVSPEEFTLDDSDIEYLNNLVKMRLNWTTDWLASQKIHMKSGFRQWRLCDGPEEEYDHPLFQKIANYGHMTLSYVIVNSQLAYIPNKLDVHVDHRKGAFTIPLVDLEQPLLFWNEKGDEFHADTKQVVHSHYHTKYQPTILNSLQPHSVGDVNEERILFQVNWPEFPIQ